MQTFVKKERRKKKKLVSSPSMRKQHFVAINFLGEWVSIQKTVMSESLPVAQNILKWVGRGGFSSFQSHSHLLLLFAMSLTIWLLPIYGSGMVWNVGKYFLLFL